MTPTRTSSASGPTGRRPEPRRRRIPVEISFREIQPSADAEHELYRHLRRLMMSFPELTGCRVLVEPSEPASAGGPQHIRIDLTVPSGHVAVEGVAARAAAQPDVKAFLADVFDDARRKLALRRRRTIQAVSHLF